MHDSAHYAVLEAIRAAYGITAVNCPNFTKFSIQTQILPRATEMWQKLKITKFKMADGRRIENHFLAITRLH